MGEERIDEQYRNYILSDVGYDIKGVLSLTQEQYRTIKWFISIFDQYDKYTELKITLADDYIGSRVTNR